MTTPPVQLLERELALAFIPLDKRALGIAFGTAIAVFAAALTILALVVDKEHKFPLHLLGAYFYGYGVAPSGILVGAAWGFVLGFSWGWFIAFARNLVLALWLMTIRIRTDLETQRDFLDHI